MSIPESGSPSSPSLDEASAEIRRDETGRPGAAISGCEPSGYIVARMRFEIVLAPSAAVSLRALPAVQPTAVKDALETHLRYEPTKVSKRRFKRLRGLDRPQFRLRVDEVRVFYDVTDQEVQILAIVPKPEAEGWLEGHGEGTS